MDQLPLTLRDETQRRPSSAMAAPGVPPRKNTRPHLQAGLARTTEDIFSRGGRQQQFSSSSSSSSSGAGASGAGSSHVGTNLAFFSMPVLPSMMQFQTSAPQMQQGIQQVQNSANANPEFASRLDGLLRFANTQFENFGDNGTAHSYGADSSGSGNSSKSTSNSGVHDGVAATPKGSPSSSPLSSSSPSQQTVGAHPQLTSSGPTERTISKPSVHIPAPRCVLARNIVADDAHASFLHSMFAKCGSVQHLSTEYLSSEGIVICQYFDVRHARVALERLQNRTLGRNKVTVEAWEVPKDVLSRVFPAHAYPTSGCITIPDLSTKIRIDDVKRKMQQFGEIWSLHMGPMNFRNSSWTAIVEYCDIRDAGRAYVAISQRRVSIGTEIVLGSAEIRQVAGGDIHYNGLRGSGGGDGGVGSNGIRGGEASNNSHSDGSARSSVHSSPASVQRLSAPVAFSPSPATSPRPPPPVPLQKQVGGPAPSLHANGVQAFLDTYLTHQQSLIMMYQQSLMNDMARQMSPGNDPAKLATIQANFQLVMKAQADMIEQRKRMIAFVATAKAIEETIPRLEGQVGQQQQQQQQQPQPQQRQQQSLAKTAPGFLPRYQQNNRQSQQHSQHHAQQYRQQNSYNRTNMESSNGRGDRNSSNSGSGNNSGGKKRRPFALVVDDILSGKDARTTIMIRNIPLKYSQQMVMSEIDETFKGLYDFFYLPMDLRRRCAVGYAFINFCKPISCATFYAHFNGRAWPQVRSTKKCNISYGRIQGQQNLIAHFKDSSIMKEDDDHVKPVVFDHSATNEPVTKLSPGAANGDQQTLGGDSADRSQLKYTSASF
jgi:hypothetical protein